LKSRLFGPTMANATVHEATQGDHETNANEGEEPSSERSIAISDTTENIGDLRRNLEATDLRHITPSARQDEPVDNTEGEELGSHNSKGTKRNKSSSKMKTKQRQSEARRQRTNKRTANVVNANEMHHRMKDMTLARCQATRRPHPLYHHQHTQRAQMRKAFWHLDHTRSPT
jgi:hypothetical protein